jgi:hypothetical protein
MLPAVVVAVVVKVKVAQKANAMATNQTEVQVPEMISRANYCTGAVEEAQHIIMRNQV